jgi:hypothetical protein
MAKTVAELREENLNLQKEIVRLETSLEFNQNNMKSLESRCSDQQEQILKLQDALVAREAPEAYEARREDESSSVETDEKFLEKLEQDKKLAVVNRDLLDKITDPSFKSAEDMMDLLAGGEVPEFLPVHKNDEG